MYIEITSDIGAHVAFSSKSRSISLNDAIQVVVSNVVNEKLIKKNFSVLLYIFSFYTDPSVETVVESGEYTAIFYYYLV